MSQPFRLDGKVALVTGGGRGIGAAISLRLADMGAQVIVNFKSDQASAARVVDEVQKVGHGLMYQADVNDRSVVEEMIKFILAQFGRLDIVVNNAGIVRDDLLMRMSDEDLDAVLDTNLRGALVVCRAVIRTLQRQRSGRIINISSVVGLTGSAGQVNYAAAKGGLITATRALAREVAGRLVTVNAVAPGYVKTDMTAGLPDTVKQQILGLIPLGRFGEAREVADMVLFLASDEAAYITGQVFSVNGGMAMQ